MRNVGPVSGIVAMKQTGMSLSAELAGDRKETSCGPRPLSRLALP